MYNRKEIFDSIQKARIKKLEDDVKFLMEYITNEKNKVKEAATTTTKKKKSPAEK